MLAFLTLVLVLNVVSAFKPMSLNRVRTVQLSMGAENLAGSSGNFNYDFL